MLCLSPCSCLCGPTFQASARAIQHLKATAVIGALGFLAHCDSTGESMVAQQGSEG